MRAAIRAFLISEGMPADRVEEHLPAGSGVELVGVATSIDTGWSELGRANAQVLIVACGHDSARALELVTAASSERPERPVLVVTEGSVNGVVRRAFDAGADDLVVLPDGPATDDLVFAIQKAVARRSAPVDGEGRAGTMVCVLGPKGGIGKTLTSCNLAVTLAQRGERVVLVDLDLQFGDLGLSLGLVPERTSYDLAVSGGTLDPEKVESYLSSHPSGARVLLAPSRPDQASVITVEFLKSLYALLRATYDYVIIDTPPGFTPEVIASIDASSHICMIGMLDALSLKNTRLGLETLELMGYDPERVRLVLNRADTNVGITHNDVVTIIGRPPDVLVPSDREITRSVNGGTPIALSAKRSEAAKAFNSLADIYAATRPGHKPKRSGRSLLRGRN